MRPPTDPYRLVRGLRVVRNYRPEPLTSGHLEAILEAGRWTGSSKNLQQWALITVTESDRRNRLAECGSFSDPLRAAPLAVVPVRLPGGNDFDTGRLAQNMMLAAWSLGVGSCPVTLHDEDCARVVLGVPPDHGVRWLIAFGYPDEHLESVQRSGAASRLPLIGRKPLDELVHREGW